MIIAIVVAVGMMVVLDAAMIAVPVSGVKLLAVMARADPVGTFIRRARPISCMPAVMAVHGVLITIDP
jgi:hypothetical protein